MGEKPEGRGWVDLPHSPLPAWRQLYAAIADGRVVMPAANVFTDDNAARKAMAGSGRRRATLERDGRLYVGPSLAKQAMRSLGEQATATLEAIEDGCLAAVAGEIAKKDALAPDERAV